MKEYFVYILSNENRTVLYVGVTSDLAKRLIEHKAAENPTSFTAKYATCRLVYYERYQNVIEAIAREKEIKKWRREKKLALIETTNPYYKFLD